MRLGHSLPPERDIASQLRGLVRSCGIELLALLIAVTCTAALSTWLPALRDWDSAFVVMLISAIWIGVCVGMYHYLSRASR